MLHAIVQSKTAWSVNLATVITSMVWWVSAAWNFCSGEAKSIQFAEFRLYYVTWCIYTASTRRPTIRKPNFIELLQNVSRKQKTLFWKLTTSPELGIFGSTKLKIASKRMNCDLRLQLPLSVNCSLSYLQCFWLLTTWGRAEFALPFSGLPFIWVGKKFAVLRRPFAIYFGHWNQLNQRWIEIGYNLGWTVIAIVFW